MKSNMLIKAQEAEAEKLMAETMSTNLYVLFPSFYEDN